MSDTEQPCRRQNCLCYASIEDEFVARHFFLEASDPSVFVRSQWCPLGSGAYLAYRVFFALGFLIWLPVDYWYNVVNFNGGQPLPWFLYATNWTLVGMTLTVCLHAGITMYYTSRPQKLQPGDRKQTLPCSMKFYWFNAAVCHNATIVISVCYWAAIMVLPHQDVFASVASKVKHSLMCAYVLLDTLVSAYPVRIFHVVYPVLCMIVYIAFNGIYFAAGGVGPNHHNYVYYQLQWDHLGESILTVLLTLLMAIVAQFILYTFFCCRRMIHGCCEVKAEEAIPILPRENIEE